MMSYEGTKQSDEKEIKVTLDVSYIYLQYSLPKP